MAAELKCDVCQYTTESDDDMNSHYERHSDAFFAAMDELRNSPQAAWHRLQSARDLYGADVQLAEAARLLAEQTPSVANIRQLEWRNWCMYDSHRDASKAAAECARIFDANKCYSEE